MVANDWNDTEAQTFVDKAGKSPADQQLALRVYTSRLIGQNHQLVQHGGGNTSCKVTRKDILGNDIAVLHVKGSGWDLGKIEAAGLPGVRLEPLKQLRNLDVLSDEDMVNLQRCNLLDSTSPTPSVETLLHAFLPHNFIDHTHAEAMLALADLPDAAKVVEKIFGNTMAVVPFIMPGFELAKKAAEIFDSNPEVEGLLLLQHGHFAFGKTAKQSYERLISQTNKVEKWLAKKAGMIPKRASPPNPKMAVKAAEILPILRGIIGYRIAEFTNNRDAAMPVMDLRAGENVEEFFKRDDLTDLSRRGVATPDHVIRTKNCPVFLTHKILAGGKQAITKAVDDFIAEYTSYFDHNAARFANDPATKKTMLLPTPNLAWIEGVGVVGISSNAKAASTAADLAEQNIVAMTYGQQCGGFYPVGQEQLFDMEYWSLEQAKLGKGTPPKLQGKIVMITGGGGAIGLAAAKSFAALGADIFLVDLEQSSLEKALEELGGFHAGIALDVTANDGAQTAIDACTARFGGLDILVSNAGAAWSGAILELDDELMRKSFELNFFAHYNFAKTAAKLFETQGRGGQILFNVSKQAVNPGKNFGAYGMPKATTFFLLRQLALELGPLSIRVNGVNADRIRSGLLDDAFISERAKARNIDEETYMAGNLIKREVEASHVGDAFTALALLERTTAHVLTVDGGNIEAALR
jgi:rhamnose utilization protein RhaD (predicted bifunctional aldolase and dehydrogenase)/NAD(P)-dependent dehydrogenase (short-subunit alcohol dehydrogenase family)